MQSKGAGPGYRTGDIYERGTNKVGTKEMGDAVLAALAVNDRGVRALIQD